MAQTHQDRGQSAELLPQLPAGYIHEPVIQDKCGLYGMCPTRPSVTENVAEYLAIGLEAGQHRGKDGAGIFTRTDMKSHVHRDTGFVTDVFPEKFDFSNRIPGNRGIAHNRYPISGTSNSQCSLQPFYVTANNTSVALAHNGQLLNDQQLRKEVESHGIQPQTETDSELMAYMIALETSEDPHQKVINACKKFKGAFSLLIMIGDDTFIVRDSLGMKPLTIAEVDDFYHFGSESVQVEKVCEKLGYNPKQLYDNDKIQSVLPGEVIHIDGDGTLVSEYYEQRETRALCAWEFFYHTFPHTKFPEDNKRELTILVSELRHQLGMALGQQLKSHFPEIQEYDYVVGVPDSGIHAAEGLAEAIGIPMKNSYITRDRKIGRTFQYKTDNARLEAARGKYHVSEAVQGKKVLLIDDSFVRATTARALSEKFHAQGVKELAVAYAAPPVIGPCELGTDHTTVQELAAVNRTPEELAGVFGYNYLAFIDYNTFKSILGPQLCYACFDNDRSIVGERKLYELEE